MKVLQRGNIYAYSTRCSGRSCDSCLFIPTVHRLNLFGELEGGLFISTGDDSVGQVLRYISRVQT